MKIYYLNQINTFAYSAQAINFINTPKVISDIKEHAEKINVSTTAVAGIMAEPKGSDSIENLFLPTLSKNSSEKHASIKKM